MRLPLAVLGVLLLLSAPAEASSYEIAIAQTGKLSGIIMPCAEQRVCSAQLAVEVESKPEILTIVAMTTPGNAYLRFRADDAPLRPTAAEYLHIPLGKTGIAASTVDLFGQWDWDWTHNDGRGGINPVWRLPFSPVMAVRISILQRN